ncbi:MAG: helix-turn-helix domain-containing protein [Thermodesulfobacteriota bacterium]
MKVFILGLNQSLASSITSLMDVLSMSNTIDAPDNKNCGPRIKFDVRIASADGKPIRCQHNILLTPHCSFDDIKQAELIILPAFMNIDNARKKHKKLVKWLIRQHAKDTVIGSICTGVFLLAETGLLDGKSATTHYTAADYFKQLYPEINMIPDQMITDEGNILCSGGASSSEDLALYLIEKYINHRVAIKCAKLFVRDLYRSSQAPYFEFNGNKSHNDSQILLCQEWLEKNHTNNISIKKLPLIANMSQRTFERRFKKATGNTPLLYLQKIRVSNAKTLLETTDQSFDEIAYKVGYNNCGAFRKIFVRNTNLLPSEYRNKFS